MDKKMWTESYRINSYLVNLRGKAGLYAVLNLIQDVGWQHAFHLNIQLEKNLAWVLTRQKLQISDWPKWNETLTIKTWLRPPASSGFLFRDYELFNGDQKIGECTTSFITMDFQTRKMVVKDWTSLGEIWRTDKSFDCIPDKVPVGVEGRPTEELAVFCVRNSDIDMNHHVNNTRYAQWILDALPIHDLRHGAELLMYEVNFLAETVPGDMVSVQHETLPIIENGQKEIRFQGVRQSDQKKVFTARMLVTG